MYTLYDKFNRRTISKHRTLQAAANAEVKHARAVRRANGSGSYIPTCIKNGAGVDVTRTSEYAEANHRATYGI